MSDPAVTVIMPALDAAGTIDDAIISLAGQNVPYEALLVDGGSRDDTVAIASAAPNFRIISAPGASIYEALNRGIEEARAPVIVFLNSDDALLPGALAAWLDAFTRAPHASISRGWANFVEMNERGELSPLSEDDRRGARPLDLHLLLRGACAINALCVRRTLFDRIGMFDSSLRLAADREWMLRAWLSNPDIVEIGRPVYRYRVHAQSSTLDRARRNFALIRRENMATAERYLNGALLTGASSEMRDAVRRWYAAEVAMLILQYARTREWRQLAATVCRVLAQQPSWPLMAAGEYAKWVWGRRR